MPVIWKYLFIGAFCHYGKFLFLKSMLNSVSFDVWQDFFRPFSAFLKANSDLKLFFACLRYFYITIIIFQGHCHSTYFFSSKIDPPLCVHKQSILRYKKFLRIFFVETLRAFLSANMIFHFFHFAKIILVLSISIHFSISSKPL
jgi:hypothetical protein